MYNNIKDKGASAQKKLYGASGDKVIDVYEANKDKPQKTLIKLMETKINELGAAKVSAHCRTTGDVFDIAPSSITDRPAFEKAVKAHSDVNVNRFHMPPTDPSYHNVVKKWHCGETNSGGYLPALFSLAFKAPLFVLICLKIPRPYLRYPSA